MTLNPPPYSSIEEFVKINIENNNSQYVAGYDGSVIGWADIVPLAHETMKHVGSLGMGVLSQYRRSGIGKKLLEKVISHAWGNGLKRLELEVFADNIAAINLYKKFGYEIEGVKRYARYIDGQYQDIVVMAQYRT